MANLVFVWIGVGVLTGVVISAIKRNISMMYFFATLIESSIASVGGGWIVWTLSANSAVGRDAESVALAFLSACLLPLFVSFLDTRQPMRQAE